MRRGPKYQGIKQVSAAAVDADPMAVDARLELTPHDKKELARFVRKYGRRAVVTAAKAIPLPGKRGRPSRGGEPYEEAVNIAECIFKWTEEHRAAGSKKPVEDALHDLYYVLIDRKTQRKDGHFSRWSKTIKRKRSDFRREVEAYLARAKETAMRISPKKTGRELIARINRGFVSPDPNKFIPEEAHQAPKGIDCNGK
jgi:hypothetical protein